MEQTENMGLSIWDTSDPVNLGEINANFQQIDAQGGMILLEIREFSNISANTIQLDATAIPFDQYDKIALRMRFQGDDGSMSMYINSMNTSGDYQYATHSLFYDSKTFGGWDSPALATMWIFCNTTYVSCQVDSSSYACYPGYAYVDDSSFGVGDIETLTISHSSGKYITGGTVEIWGVKEFGGS